MTRLHLILYAILVVIIIVLGVDNEYLRSKPVNVEVDKSLQRKIDSLSIINSSLEIKINQYQNSIDLLSKKLIVKEKKVITLETTEDEKILAIDSLSSNELYIIFSGFKP